MPTIAEYDSVSDLLLSDPRWLAIKDKIVYSFPDGDGFTLEHIYQRIHTMDFAEFEAWINYK